jgi:hypothetical protein
MCEAYAKRSVGDDLGKGKVRCFDIEIALDNLQIRRDAAQEFVCLAVGDVSKAENLSDLARRKKLLELEQL